MHPFEQRLIEKVARHAATIRRRGRYPFLLSHLWPGLVFLVTIVSLEMLRWQWGTDYRRGGSWLITLMGASALVRITIYNFRSLYFAPLRTGVPAADSATGLQVALNAAGYSLEWTPGGEAAILFGVTGDGRRKVRHAVVFVPADGRIWYTVHDPSGPQFFVSQRKPLRHLVAVVEAYFGPRADAE